MQDEGWLPHSVTATSLFGRGNEEIGRRQVEDNFDFEVGEGDRKVGSKHLGKPVRGGRFLQHAPGENSAAVLEPFAATKHWLNETSRNA